jgi:zinc transport system substrate-binding protein
MKNLQLLGIGILCIALAGCAPSPDQATEPLKVVATVYPLANLAEHVGSGAATISTIVPFGAEPHDYEPTPRDIASIYDANVLLINGAGLDDWAVKIADEARAKGISVLIMRDALTFRESSHHEEAEHHEEDEHEDEEAHDDHGPLDPHFWLDPQKAAAATHEIAEIMATAHPDRAETYRKAAAVYERELMALDEEYVKGLASCIGRSAIVSHDAFGYLSARYNLELIPIAGLSPEEEPSAKQMGALVTLARQKKIPAVFFESLVSPRLAEVFASELNLQALPLNPIEGLTAQELQDGATYESIMRTNLYNLRQGLRCP